MEEKVFDTSEESMTANKNEDSNNLKTLAENSLAKLLKIQTAANHKLEQIRRELSQLDDKAFQYQNLKSNEQFYLQALEESKHLSHSIKDKITSLETLNKENAVSQTNVHDVIINVEMKEAPSQGKMSENECRNSMNIPHNTSLVINELRGLTPGQNLFIRQKNLDSLTYQETDILTATNLSETEKIGGLRSGLAVEQLIQQKQNNNQRSERQLPTKERQRVRQYSRTRIREREARQRS